MPGTFDDVEMRVHTADLAGRETGADEEHEGPARRVHGAKYSSIARRPATRVSGRDTLAFLTLKRSSPLPQPMSRSSLPTRSPLPIVLKT
jgi:hypothetical protein